MANKIHEMQLLNKLLLDESPLVLLPSLAAAIGLEAAVVLQQLHFLLRMKLERHKDRPKDIERDIRDGRVWVWNTYDEWKRNYFYFLSVRTLQRIFLSLEKKGLILSGKYNESYLNKTKWYTINYNHPLLQPLQGVGSENSIRKSVIGCDQHKTTLDSSNLASSAIQCGTKDSAKLASYKTKNSVTNNSSNTTTTKDKSKSSSKNIPKEKEDTLLVTFPVPTSTDEMKNIIRDVISIAYPSGERIRNVNNLIFSMRKKLISGELNVPEGWAEFQRKKNERINLVNQNNSQKEDAIDFEKAKIDFSALPDIEQKKYLDVARRYAKFIGRISESEIQINAIHVWTHEREKK